MRHSPEVQSVLEFYQGLGLLSADDIAALTWLMGASPYAAQMQRALRQCGAID
jgi:hypothetical protein